MKLIIAFLCYIWWLLFGKTDDDDQVIRRFMILVPFGFRLRKEEDCVVADCDRENVWFKFYKVDDWHIARVRCWCYLCRTNNFADNGYHQVYFRIKDSYMKIIIVVIHAYQDGHVRISDYYSYDLPCDSLDRYEYHSNHNMVTNKTDYILRETITSNPDFIEVMNDSDFGLGYILETYYGFGKKTH